MLKFNVEPFSLQRANFHRTQSSCVSTTRRKRSAISDNTGKNVLFLSALSYYAIGGEPVSYMLVLTDSLKKH